MATFRLFSGMSGGSVTTDGNAYSMGCQFTVNTTVSLHAIWWWTPTGADVLPSECAIFQQATPGTGSILAGTHQTSPTWSGAAGSGGWVHTPYADNVNLVSTATYQVVILLPGSGTQHEYGATGAFWSTGAGSGGITSGPLSAPNNAGSTDGGQDLFVSSVTLVYPNQSFNATNYWMDVEVSDPPGPPPVASAAVVGKDTRKSSWKKLLLAM